MEWFKRIKADSPEMSVRWVRPNDHHTESESENVEHAEDGMVKNCEVKRLYTKNKESVAILYSNGNVQDEESMVVLLTNVKDIFNNDYAFAALKQNGSIVAWGDANAGGELGKEYQELSDVVHIGSSKKAFAARRANGKDFAWGKKGYQKKALQNLYKTLPLKERLAESDSEGILDPEELLLKYQKELKSEKERVKILEKELEDAKRDALHLAEQSKRDASDKYRIEQQMKMQKRARAELERFAKDLEERSNTKEKELNVKIDNMIKEVMEGRNYKDELEKQLQTVETENSLLHTKNNLLKENFLDAFENGQKLQDELHAVWKDWENLKDQNEGLKSMIEDGEDLERQLAEAKSREAANTEKIEFLKKQMEQENRKVKHDLEELERKLAEAEKHDATNTVKIESLREKVEEKNRRLEEIKEAKRENELKLAEAEKIKLANTVEIAVLKEKVSEKNRRIEEMKEERDKSQKQLMSMVQNVERISDGTRNQLRDMSMDLQSQISKIDAKTDIIVEKVTRIDFDKIGDAGETMNQHLRCLLKEITGIKVDVADLTKTTEGQSRALIQMGEHMLPVPTDICIHDGRFRDRAELKFICGRSNQSKSYFLSKPSKWVKYAAIGAQMTQTTVNIVSGQFKSAISGVMNIKKSLQNIKNWEGIDGFSQDSVGTLSSKDHDEMLEELKAMHFYEEWEYIQYNKDFGWYLNTQSANTMSNQPAPSGCGCIIS